MSFYINTKIKTILGSLLAAVILLWAIVSGNANGKNLAQANAVVVASQNISSALMYFYKDQGRFPSPTEFAQSEIMLNYLSSFPLPQFVSKTCSETFVYKRTDPNAFVLNFCLPEGVGNYQKGWNSITGSPAD